MLVAGGYPEDYAKGEVITGLEPQAEVLTFHAGTELNGKGEIVTNGGRVLALTALGANIPEALVKVTSAADKITWKNRYYRKDIGFDLR